MKELTEEMELEMENYIEKFEKEMEQTVSKEVEPKLLLTLFREYVEQNSSPSKKYFILLKELGNIEKDLLKTFTSDEQRLLFEKYNWAFQELEQQRVEQFFVYGFCMGNNLNKEVNNILNIDQKHKN